MAYVIGTDEAGYGPFLGPLTIAASVWQVPDLQSDFAEALQGPGEGTELPVVIDDSKRVFQRQRGLASLERTVLPALATTLNPVPLAETWAALWKQLVPGSETIFEQLPWYQDYDRPIPIDLTPQVLREVKEELETFWNRVSIRLVRLQAVAVFPQQFNEQIEQTGSKGELLTRQTLELVRRQMESLQDDEILIHCDKHGGRNYYAPALQQVFPEYLIEVRKESRWQSVYRWGPPQRRREIHFTAKGDSFLPTALASMVAKYVRELAMQALNQFWCERVPGLRPTAGYPADARRFKEEIAELQGTEQIADNILWRNR